MTFSEMDMLALFGTNCQFLVIFLKKISAIHFVASLDLYLVIISLSAENAVSYNMLLQKKMLQHFDCLLRQQWTIRIHAKPKFWD